jgi:hypothetical protein
LRSAALILGLASALGAAGCAAFRPRPLDPGLFMLAPQAAGAELSLTQILRFSKGDKAFEALAAVELSRDLLSVAALGPMGNRVLALSWDGKNLEQERDPSIPAELPLVLILRDLQLALWPASALREALSGKGWSLEDAGHSRILRKDGRDVVRISYGGQDRWHSAIQFEHLTLGYRLDIQAVKDENP